jgi:uncharacterized protein YaiL (DUF2058 family)
MASLQEQLLKAGLTTKDKATKVKSAKRKQNKINRKHKIETIDENKEAAKKALENQAERARQLNQEKNAIAEEKAVLAQIKQLIEVNRQPLGKPSISFNFSDNGAIKKLEVSNEIHKHITNGLLAISKLAGNYVLIPKAIADKVKLRSSDFIVILNDKVESEETDEDDPYADYQIPDDLMW